MKTVPLSGAGRTLPTAKVPRPFAGTLTMPLVGVVAIQPGSARSATVQLPAGTPLICEKPSVPVTAALRLP